MLLHLIGNLRAGRRSPEADTLQNTPIRRARVPWHLQLALVDLALLCRLVYPLGQGEQSIGELVVLVIILQPALVGVELPGFDCFGA